MVWKHHNACADDGCKASLLLLALTCVQCWQCSSYTRLLCLGFHCLRSAPYASPLSVQVEADEGPVVENSIEDKGGSSGLSPSAIEGMLLMAVEKLYKEDRELDVQMGLLRLVLQVLQRHGKPQLQLACTRQHTKFTVSACELTQKSGPAVELPLHNTASFWLCRAVHFCFEFLGIVILHKVLLILDCLFMP